MSLGSEIWGAVSVLICLVVRLHTYVSLQSIPGSLILYSMTSLYRHLTQRQSRGALPSHSLRSCILTSGLPITMKLSDFTLLVPILGLCSAQLEPNFTSNSGVKIFNPNNFFNTTGPWSLMSQAGDYLYIAGKLTVLPSNRGSWHYNQILTIPFF